MNDILIELEPRIEERLVILYQELDDFTEILFLNKGSIDIGFEINKKACYVIRKSNGCIIADLGCTFNHKSNYIYRTHTECRGYSIRKQAWLRILNNYP